MKRARNLTQPRRSIVPCHGKRDDLEEDCDYAYDKTLANKLVEGRAVVVDVKLFRGEGWGRWGLRRGGGGGGGGGSGGWGWVHFVCGWVAGGTT